MAYQLYTTEVVFTDHNINAICNLLIDHLETKYSANILNTKFGVTGSVARMIQGAANVPIPVIAFVTNDVAYYDYLRNNIQNFLPVDGVIDFSDRIQIITSYVYIEIWNKTGALTLINSNGIISEVKSQIPNYIL